MGLENQTKPNAASPRLAISIPPASSAAVQAEAIGQAAPERGGESAQADRCHHQSHLPGIPGLAHHQRDQHRHQARHDQPGQGIRQVPGFDPLLPMMLFLHHSISRFGHSPYIMTLNQDENSTHELIPVILP